MSSRASIIAFDDDKFKNVVIPALREGEGNQLIIDEIQRFNYSNAKFENLKSVLDLFNEDLTACQWGDTFAADKNGVYKTNTKFKSPHPGCWTYEDLAILLERLMMRHCARYHVYLGKVQGLGDVITSMDSSVKRLLDKLCDFTFIWKHCACDADGIYGWLNSKEVAWLSENSASIITTVDNPYYAEPKEPILQALNDLLRISEKENLGLLFGQSVEIKIIDPIKPYTINELVKNMEYGGGCEPRFGITSLF